MDYLTVIKDGKYTGIQYTQDTPEIREHHASQGETLVVLNRVVDAGEIPTAEEIASTPPSIRIIDGGKISDETRAELAGAATIEDLRTVLSDILLGR